MSIRYLSGINVDSNTLFVDDANNRVGIGTGSPTSELDVRGNNMGISGVAPTILIYSSTTSGGKIAFVDQNWSSQIVGDGGRLRFNIGGTTEAMRIDNNGYVGINATSPNARLWVEGDATTNGTAVFYNPTKGAVQSHIHYGTNGDWYIRSSSTSGNVNIQDLGGNVGIGTSSAGAKLHVVGTESRFGGVASGYISVYNANSRSGYLQANEGSDFRIASDTNDMTFYVNGSERVRFTVGGNVGIGTSSPSYKLDVYGDIRSGGADPLMILQPDSGTYAFFQKLSSSNGNYLRLYDGTNYSTFWKDGNVGIGTTSPSQKLHVNGVIEAGPASTSGGPMIYQSYNSSNYIGSIGSEYSSGAMLIGYGATGKNGASGYVSTFSNFPGIRGLIKLASGEFSILSSISAVQTAVGGDLTMTTNFIVTNEGNVGIGTTSPAYKLDVSGTARVTSTLLGGGRISAATEYRLNDNSYSRVAILDGAGAFAGGYNFNINSDFPQHDSTGAVSAYYYHSAGYISLFTNSSQAAGTAASERLRITSAGNVGIGTTSPSAKLHVSSAGETTLTVDSTSSGTARISLTGAGGGAGAITSTTNGLYLYASGANAITLNTNGSERFRVSSDGKVGIAVTSLTASLSIGSSSYDSNPLTGIEYAQVTGGGRLDLKVQTWGTGSNYGLTTGLSVVTPGFDTADVRVGIGTTSPSYKLDVNGATQIQNELILSTNDAAFRLYRTTGINYFDWSSGQDLRFSTVTTIGGAGRSTAVTFLSDGNVGIGTTSPISKLTVLAASTGYSSDSQIKISDGSTSYYGGLSFDDSGATRLSIRNSYDGNGSIIGFGFGSSADKVQIIDGTGLIVNEGNVGIGTTSPSQKLEVAGALVVGMTVPAPFWNAQFKDFSDGSGIYISSVNGGGGKYIAGNAYYYNSTLWRSDKTVASAINLDNGTVVFYTNSGLTPNVDYSPTERMRITAAGNVGIGTTSPAEILELSTTTDPKIRFVDVGNTDAKIGIVGSTALGFEVNGSERMRIASTGATRLNAYGSGSFTGTVAYNLAVDSSGNVIETAGGVVDGSGTANYVSKWSDANTLTNSVIYENGGNIGIGVTDADYPLTVGSINVGGAGANLGIIINSVINTAIPSSSVKAIIGVTNSGFGYSAGSLLLQPRTGVNGVVAIATEGTEKFRVNQDGNVGIGTTSPSSALDVSLSGGGTSGIRFKGWSDASTPYLLSLGTESYPDQFQIKSVNGLVTMGIVGSTGAAPDLAFQTNTTERMRITSAGNVGIGTTSPSEKLHVVGNIKVEQTSNVNAVLTLNPNSGVLGTGYQWNLVGVNSAASYAFQIREASSTYLTITNSAGGTGGNVGIGTTSPAQKLHVVGNTTITGVTYTDVVQTYSGASIDFRHQDASVVMRVDTANARVGIGTTSPLGPLDVRSTGLAQIYFGYPNAGEYGYLGRDANSGLYSLNIVQNANLAIWTNNTERMRITNAGNVGIGTTNPGAKLEIETNDLVTRAIFVKGIDSEIYAPTNNGGYGVFSITSDVNSTRSSKFFVNAAGNVGIGTTSPLVKLHVDGTGTQYIRVSSSDNATFQQIGAQSGGTFVEYKTLYRFVDTDAGERMRITSDGTVGIGTTSPSSSYKLDVAGAIRTTDVNGYSIDVSAAFGDNSGASISILNRGTTRALRILGSSNNGWGDILLNSYGAYVGIGTTTPTQTLHVSGNVRVTGAYYDSNNSAGSSGQVLSSTGSGTAWVNQGEATATSLFDLLPAARVTYDWTVQLTAGTWADIFSSNTVLSNGTWMVQVYVDDFAVGGQQYQETYSGVMSWGSASSTNQGGNQAISEIVLHRSGHAANSGNFYLRTVERPLSTLLFQGMSNQTYSAASTINFKFVKIF